jgi:chromosome segregation ATPase
MKRLLSIVCLCASASPALAREDANAAAKKSLLQRIDTWLGETDALRSVIERGLTSLEVMTDKLLTSRIKARVNADMLAKELKNVKKVLGDTKTVLVQLRADLEKMKADPTYTVTYAGKTYTRAEDLAKVLEQISAQYEKLLATSATLDKRSAEFEQTASTLESRYDEAKKKLTENKDRLKDLDAKIALVKTQRAAAEALDVSDTGFVEKVRAIETQLKKLEATPRTS